MFDCGVTVLQSMLSSSNIFAVLHHWIPGSINRHTIAVVEKANCNEKSRDSVSYHVKPVTFRRALSPA